LTIKPRFNPRTRTGCDGKGNAYSLELFVSTHAPARGATARVHLTPNCILVSTHAPARGATTARALSSGNSSSFQPTHPHGVRPRRSEADGERVRVSTHAPARGATGTPAHQRRRCLLFQPTHPHGVRHIKGLCYTVNRDSFNPRTRTGCDDFQDNRREEVKVSTHAPARGATTLGRTQLPCQGCFNPRTRTGCDEVPKDKSQALAVSTHAPARGATKPLQE